jgi:predicted enzyme related to lactoylglutathione lyase
MSKSKPQPKSGHFIWNELVTTSVPAAKKFYAGLLGWKMQPFGKNAVGYTLFKQGKEMVGGMMKCPQPGNPAQWIPYVFVDDVDAAMKKATKLGGEICVPPFNVETVGRIAVLSDPQGAAIGIIKPLMQTSA